MFSTSDLTLMLLVGLTLVGALAYVSAVPKRASRSHRRH